MMGLETHISPYKFEGDAELKQIKKGLYVGAVGMRSDIKAYKWMEEKFGIKIIPVALSNPHLYHLDVNFCPITRDLALCCTESFSREELKEIEKHIGLIDIPTKHAEIGGTSIVRFYDKILIGSCIKEEIHGTPDYFDEADKNQIVEKACVQAGLDLVIFNLSEMFKNGGDISCDMLSLNRKSFNIK